MFIAGPITVVAWNFDELGGTQIGNSVEHNLEYYDALEMFVSQFPNRTNDSGSTDG